MSSFSSLSDRIAQRTGSGVPKFKSLPPPSLPISPPSLVSPSSYFAIPYGLSPAELLDSPVLLSASNILPSPTTGSFPFSAFDWNNNSERTLQQSIKNEEQRNLSDFSFQTQINSLTSDKMANQTWEYQTSANQDCISSEKANTNSEQTPMQSFSPEISTIQTTNQTNNNIQSEYNPRKRSDDGYNWRKYGQKQVKGSENPRSYYKCTHPNCPMRKKVEMSFSGEITEIVYKGSHNHPKPQSTRRTSSSSTATSVISQSYQTQSRDIQEQSHGSNGIGNMDPSVTTPENSSLSVDDSMGKSSQRSRSGEFDEDEPDTKRWKGEAESEGNSTGGKTVREPRVVVQTKSDIDILFDGYRWRKYGQKVVKGNPNPRSYYKCTSAGCSVRKHVERASHDAQSVITTYEGKHNHDVPAARGSGNQSITRPGYHSIMAARPLALPHNPNYPMAMRPQTGGAEAPYTLEMLQSPGSFGYSGSFGNSLGSYMNAPQENEPFLESQH